MKRIMTEATSEGVMFADAPQRSRFDTAFRQSSGSTIPPDSCGRIRLGIGQCARYAMNRVLAAFSRENIGENHAIR